MENITFNVLLPSAGTFNFIVFSRTRPNMISKEAKILRHILYNKTILSCCCYCQGKQQQSQSSTDTSTSATANVATTTKVTNPNQTTGKSVVGANKIIDDETFPSSYKIDDDDGNNSHNEEGCRSSNEQCQEKEGGGIIEQV